MTKEEQKAYNHKYYKRQTEKQKADRKNWGKRNPELLRECKLRSNQKHKAKRAAYNKQWRERNAGKVTAYARNYQLLKLKRIPAWLSEKDRQLIKEFYANRPEGHHVDHIVPLQGKEVSGLHVPWNLQYLPATENIKKSNKLKNQG